MRLTVLSPSPRTGQSDEGQKLAVPQRRHDWASKSPFGAITRSWENTAVILLSGTSAFAGTGAWVNKSLQRLPSAFRLRFWNGVSQLRSRVEICFCHTSEGDGTAHVASVGVTYCQPKVQVTP